MNREKSMAAIDALMELSVGDDAARRRVAELLREGNPDPELLRGLANMIDPDRPGWMGVQLAVKRTSGAGRPARPKKHRDLAQFLALHAIVFEDQKREAVIATAMERFRVKRSTAFQVLSEEREYWDAHPERLRRFREDALVLRARGKPVYQPI